MDLDRLAPALHTHTAAFAAAVDGGDPAARVPTCPEWRLRDLVGHVGQAHRWAAGLVRTRESAPVPDPRDADPTNDWTGWLTEGAAELVDAVRTTGPDTTVTTLLGPGPAVFWLRRMLHDLVVHHADATLTTSLTTFEVAPEVAADGLDEALGLLTAPGAEAVKPALAGLRGNGEKLLLRTESTGWLLTRTETGPTCLRTIADADVTVSGHEHELLLMLTRRLSPDQLTVTGERALLDHWLSRTAL